LKIPIWLQETQDLRRTREPVRLGVPISRGLLNAPDDIALIDAEQRPIPVQGRCLALWPDRSIKWLLLDFFADLEPNSKRPYFIVDKASKSEKTDIKKLSTIEFIEHSSHFSIDTGKAQFVINKTLPALISEAVLQDNSMVSKNGLQVQLTDSKERLLKPQIDNYKIENSGPLRTTVVAEGRFIASQKPLPIVFKSRMSFFASASAVKIEFLIRNTQAAVHPGGLWDLGDPGSLFFKDLSIRLQPHSEVNHIAWYSERLEEDTQTSTSQPWSIYQNSSGGECWNSRNHVDRFGELSVSFRGYRVCEWQAGDRRVLSEGMRAQPALRLVTSSGWLAVTVKDFWQNFPKALRWDGEYLDIGLFPGGSGNNFELQGGEQKRHVIFLDFGLPEQETAIPMLQHPLHAWVDPVWVEETAAVSFFVPQQDDPNQDYVKYITHIVEGSNAFVNKREIIDEYGWRHFGDLYADHEAVNETGPDPLISHYNNQYDFIYGAFIHYLRTGDRRWYQLMDEAARHTVDIDIYHTDEDKSAYNHGLFWHTDHYKDVATCSHRAYSRKNGSSGSYGGGPSNEQNYTTGLRHYFYLTGDPEAASAVMELADWVIGMDEGERTLLGVIDSGPTGDASKTASMLYHGPGRGAGNSINALLDAYALSNNRRYFSKAEALLQRCIHPLDNISELKLDEPEYRWSYLVFLQVLGKYLDTKIELGEIDYGFYYARDSLLNYANWMMDNEVPYKDVLHKVDIPTETWPAQDIRKCHIFHLAAKYGSPDTRLAFRNKAEIFFDRCLKDLLGFDTAYLTRPLVLLSVYGYIHAYFRKYSCSAPEFQIHAYDFGTPDHFIPQKARLRKALIQKCSITTHELRRLSRDKWYSLMHKLR